MLFATQPVAALFECADETKAHHHFPVFGALMSQIGFKQAWEQAVPYHYLAHHYRNRWLALWIWSDVSATEVANLFKLMVPPIVPWTDDRYAFHLPQEMQHQLKLSPDQFLTYGELQLLPVGKRAKVHPSVTAFQVIRARIPSPREPLATLCSSYTQQRNLDRDHLARRGIHASVIEQDGDFLFLDPVRFVALLGTVSDLAIPLDLSKAFHQTGNAISVPHALLSIFDYAFIHHQSNIFQPKSAFVSAGLAACTLMLLFLLLRATMFGPAMSCNSFFAPQAAISCD